MEIERRYYPIAEFRIDKRHDGGIHLTGYAAMFNKLSVEMAGFREKINPGAFEETIKTDDIRALFNHNAELPLGRSKVKQGPGSLILTEDDRGLLMDLNTTDTTYSRDLKVNIESGVITQMSFGFRVPPGGDEIESSGDEIIRTLNKVKLMDVSPVTFPAYTDTTVQVRNFLRTAHKSNRLLSAPGIDIRRKRLRLHEFNI